VCLCVCARACLCVLVVACEPACIVRFVSLSVRACESICVEMPLAQTKRQPRFAWRDQHRTHRAAHWDGERHEGKPYRTLRNRAIYRHCQCSQIRVPLDWNTPLNSNFWYKFKLNQKRVRPDQEGDSEEGEWCGIRKVKCRRKDQSGRNRLSLLLQRVRRGRRRQPWPPRA